MLSEILDDLENEINELEDDLIKDSFKEARSYIENNSPFLRDENINSEEVDVLLKSHGLLGAQLKLKIAMYNKIKESESLERAWWDFVNSFLNSIPNELVPGIGAIKELKDVLHIKKRYEI